MNKGKNLMLYIGLVISLLGIVLYDPLGFLFKGTGLIVIGIGLGCLFFGYQQFNDGELVSKLVEGFEKERRK